MSQVKIYTVPMCSQCIRLKEFLHFNGVEFEEINLHEEEKEGSMLKEKTGTSETPVTRVDNSFVAGFDRERIAKMLEDHGIKPEEMTVE
ncbi:MAG: glutaredoxin family protein [Candidatus Nanohaloarchaea archaeon]